LSGSDSRYAEILRRLEQKRRQQASLPGQNRLAGVLDALNTVGFLEQIKRRPPAGTNAYGPKVFSGSTGNSEWAGVVLWHKPKGYYHYETLGLLGIWAIEEHHNTRVTVGEKALAFHAPVFNPESYYHHIKRRFDLYYPQDAGPPSQTLCEIIYDPQQRLEQREIVAQTLRTWFAFHNQA
jgi:hypothetical protein